MHVRYFKNILFLLIVSLIGVAVISPAPPAFSKDLQAHDIKHGKQTLYAPDEMGPYNVGIRTFENVPVFGPALPRIQVYYPTLSQPNCQTTYTITGVGGTYLRSSPLCAVQNASPAPGKFPLVVHSHGGGGPGADQQRLSQLPVHETLASHGFVIVVPRHNGNTPPPAAPGFRRVRDLPLVIDYMLAATNPISASIDAERIGLSGFSTGGRTSLAVAGGWASQGISADARIKAMVLYEPGRDSSLEDVATIDIPYLAMGGTRIENGTVIVPELFETTVLATPRIYVKNQEAIHFNYQTDLCGSIEETREAALNGDPSLRDPVTGELLIEPLTNMIPNPANPNLRICNPAMGAAGNQACTFWNQGEVVVPLLPPTQAFGFGGGRNVCTRIGADSGESLDVDPVDGLTDDFVPGTDIRLFEANDRFNYAGQNSDGDPSPIPSEEFVPMVKLYTVAFFKKFLAGDGRYMRFLTPGYADRNDLQATVTIVDEDG